MRTFSEWGGSFEVWDKPMERKVASFPPTENRMVCFSTGSHTWHGNPEPVNHPDGLPRQDRLEHSTLFKPRPGSGDMSEARDRRRQLVKDMLPPVVYRRVVHRLKRLGL